MDTFCYKKATHLLVVNYVSRFVDIVILAQSTPSDVILHQRSIFAQHGTPETVMSDNGTHDASQEFSRFADDEGLALCTSSPHFPQSTTIRLNKRVDPYNMYCYHTKGNC